jgi:uncharacterized OsmC-like protein
MGKLTVNYKGDKLFQSTVGEHTVTIEMPEGWGGKNRALLPPQYLLISIGACIGAFVERYCADNDINTEGMSIEMQFDKMEERFDNVQAIIHMPNADFKGREKAILRVAEHCFVDETIKSLSEGTKIALTAD